MLPQAACGVTDRDADWEAAGRASGGSDQAAERPSDEHDPDGIDVRVLDQRTFLLTK
jgi:hypothetical protein